MEAYIYLAIVLSVIIVTLLVSIIVSIGYWKRVNKENSIHRTENAGQDCRELGDKNSDTFKKQMLTGINDRNNKTIKHNDENIDINSLSDKIHELLNDGEIKRNYSNRDANIPTFASNVSWFGGADLEEDSITEEDSTAKNADSINVK